LRLPIWYRRLFQPRVRQEKPYYAAPIARRCWKHSRQKTGRPCVGRKGTVVSLPHWEQLVFVSDRIVLEFPPVASARLALQPLQRFGSFLNPLSAKNICSPPVKTNSAPHSEHFRTLSWYSMEAFPPEPQQEKGTRRTLHEGSNPKKGSGEPAGLLGPAGATLLTATAVHYLTGAWITERGAKLWTSRIKKSILFAPLLFTQTLPRKRFLCPALLAGFHVEAMLLDFLDDVFLLHLALKTPQGIFQWLTLLDNDFSHLVNSPPIRLGLVC